MSLIHDDIDQLAIIISLRVHPVHGCTVLSSVLGKIKQVFRNRPKPSARWETRDARGTWMATMDARGTGDAMVDQEYYSDGEESTLETIVDG